MPARARCWPRARAKCARSRPPEPCLDRAEDVSRNSVAGPLAVQPQPAVPRGLTAVALPDARQQSKIALVSIAPGGLPPDRACAVTVCARSVGLL